MKKKKIAIFSISAILLFMLITIIYNKKNTFNKEGITYALTVNGVSQNSFPSKGMYRVDTECSNATCKWDYEKWKLYIENITGKVSCNISFTTISKNYLNNYITGLSGTEQGTGQVVNEKGYRYEGQNPNNYVWFNNELWRIIGVFDSTSHGVANTNLVKIIRNESIGGLVWDKSNKTNWSTASLNALLNNEYLNSTNGTNGANCYGSSTNTRPKCDYRTSGIKDIYRQMIKEATWYLGGYSSSNVTTDAMYGYERDATSKYEDNPSSISAKVGLMYASDYGYAVPAANCSRTINLISQGNTNCTLNNWLYGNGRGWTITTYLSDTNFAFNVDESGVVSIANLDYGWSVKPTVYLESSIYVIDGDGSITDPYIIGM